MAQRESKARKKTVKRVMHEFKHGELPRGRGGKVKNRKQAIAIALHEAGASKYESPKKNRANLRKTKSKERRGETGQARSEGRTSASRKTAGRKTAARKTTARKTTTKKSVSRKTTRKTATRKTPARKTASRKSATRKKRALRMVTGTALRLSPGREPPSPAR